MKKANCVGCYNNIYNNGAGGAKECFSFITAKLIWRQEVHVDAMPPHTGKKKRFPDCYRKPRYAYLNNWGN